MKNDDYNYALDDIFSEEILPHALTDEDIEALIREAEMAESEMLLGDLSAQESPEEMEPVHVRSISGKNSLDLLEEGEVREPDLKAQNKPHKLHENHRAKVRKRFRDEGLSNFQKHNILELLLFYAIPRKDTNEIAHRLLNAYHGNLSEVLGADVESLMRVEGVGESAAILLSMMPQVFRVYREELMRREGISGRKKVEEYIANRFTGESVEKVLVACLDNRWNLLGDEFISTGSVNVSTVNKRAMIDVCLRYNATAVIIAHNHPRGNALPSRDDLSTTVEVRSSMELIGARLIDHIIVAGEDYISLACSKNYNALF